MHEAKLNPRPFQSPEEEATGPKVVFALQLDFRQSSLE